MIQRAKGVTNETERGSLVIAIAIVSDPTAMFIDEIEREITRKHDAVDPLLLVYGALVSSAGSHMEVRMVSFLTDQLQNAQNDEDVLIHLLHALGNTKCNLVIEHIVQFLDYNDEALKVTTITALRFFTNSPYIQERLLHILLDNSTEAIVNSIIDSLSEGFEHHKSKFDIASDINEALMNVTLAFDNADLRNELLEYYQLIASEDSLKLARILTEQATQHKRATTTYWATSNSDYNAIASQSSRLSDVRTYPFYRSYLWSEKVGRTNATPEIYLQAAAGIFGGINLRLNFKVFGRAVIRAHAFGASYDAVKIEFLYQKTGKQIIKRYCTRIASIVLSDFSLSVPNLVSGLKLFSCSPVIAVIWLTTSSIFEITFTLVM